MFLMYSTFSILLILCYLFIILCYIYYWNQLEEWEIPSKNSYNTPITIIVAARNESDNIGACIDALLAQDYPKHLLEIWIVDDHSEDATAAIVETYEQEFIHLLALPEGKTGKKQAIEAAIQQSTNPLIVTTDADCVMKNRWLSYLVSYYEHHTVKLIAAPVSFHREQSLFERFQSLDFMGMMAVSGAGIKGRFMNICNGANLAYERQAFEVVNGFEGIDHVASGDDMLLMQKIAQKYPNQIGYVKNSNCQTFTRAKETVRAFVQQRIRWTSKSSAYTGWQVLVMLATVWLLCISMVADLFLIPYNRLFLFWLLFKFVVKGIADFFFLGNMALFFNRLELMRSFIPALFLHWWYIVYVGTVGNFVKRYEWKGRKVQ